MKKKLFKSALFVLALATLTGCGASQGVKDPAASGEHMVDVSPLTLSLAEETIEVGGSTQAILNVSGLVTSGTFIFESSDPTVATVSATGTITALKAGKTTITVKDKEDLRISDKKELTVVDDLDQKFTVKFVNYDGSILYEEVVNAGEGAEYKGEEPFRPNTADTMFVFSGWDKTFDAITEDTVITAVYAESAFDDYFFEGVNGVYKFVGYSGEDEVLTIPTSFNGGIVNSIGSNVLSGNTHVKKVIIPDGIESIEARAFASNDLLEEVEVSGSVTYMGDYAFGYCTNLKKATFGEGVTELGNYCLYQCSSLKEVVFPSTLTRIGDYCFFMSGLETLTVPASVIYLGSAFAGTMSNLTSVTIEGNIVTDEDSTSWFSSDKALTSVNFTGDVDALQMAAFMSCTSLAEITLPDGCETLGPRAFSGCTALEKVYLGASTSNFQEDCFANVPALTNGGILLKEGDTTHTIKDGILYSNAGKKISLVLDASKVPAELNFSQMGVTEIGDFAFYENETITKIDLTGVTSVGESAFESCSNIVMDLVIPSSVTYCGDAAFSYLGITSLDIQTTFGDGVVPYQCFRNNRSMKTATMVSGITRIDYGAFGWCNNTFVSCFIPKTVVELGQYAFNINNNLTVYYEGTEEEWNAIKIDNGSAGSFDVVYEQTGLPVESD